MSKTLSDTAAIAAKHVTETCNPDYSCFQPRSNKCLYPAKETSAGPERPHHAVQVLQAKRPGGVS